MLRTSFSPSKWLRKAKKPAKPSYHNPGKGCWYGFAKQVLDREAKRGETYEQCALRFVEEAKAEGGGDA